MIHHVQIACPPGTEEALRAYYVGVLGMAEKPKPPALAPRGGCWFAANGIELHLGVEEDFRPARKAHPGLLWPDLDALAARLEAAGYPVIWAAEVLAAEGEREREAGAQLPGLRRFHTADPHGNRIEFLAPN
jgi:catechol 2,3-dioxygenase-like lactoylglutathione lyase family enzyme